MKCDMLETVLKQLQSKGANNENPTSANCKKIGKLAKNFCSSQSKIKISFANLVSDLRLDDLHVLKW